MNKEKFLNNIKKHLILLDKNIVNESLEYYSEIIDDLIEEGYSENEIIKRIGTPLEIANRILEINKIDDNEYFKSKEVIDNSSNISIIGIFFKILFLFLTFPFWIVILALVFVILICIIIIPFVIYTVILASIISSIYVILYSLINANMFVFGVTIARIGMGLMILSISSLMIIYSTKLFSIINMIIKIVLANFNNLTKKFFNFKL